jgi:hypothetical protein
LERPPPELAPEGSNASAAPFSALQPERSDDWWFDDMDVERGEAIGAGMNWEETLVLM